jgi:hypothetical protein
MRNTADVTGGKLIAVRCGTDNTLVAFYDIHGRKRELLFILVLNITGIFTDTFLITTLYKCQGEYK